MITQGIAADRAPHLFPETHPGTRKIQFETIINALSLI